MKNLFALSPLLFLWSSAIAAPTPTIPTGMTVAPNSTFTVFLNDIPGIFSSAEINVAGDFSIDPLAGSLFHRGSSNPSLTPGILTSVALFHQTIVSPPSSGYQNGAIAGDDNWLHMRFGKGTPETTDDEVVWTQFEFTPTTASVVKYVYDAVNPTQAITLSQAVSAVPEPSVITGLLFSALALVAFRRGNLKDTRILNGRR